MFQLSSRTLVSPLVPPQMAVLPSELCIQVIEELGRPSHPLAYRLPAGVCSALNNLSKANSTFHRWTVPVLYRRVLLTPSNTPAFARSLESLMGASGAWDLSLAPKVTSLACAGFPESNLLDLTTMVGNILYLLSGQIERLLLDMPLRDLYSSTKVLQRAVVLRTIMDNLTGLVEFISIRDELYLGGWTTGPVCWPDWPKIRRLALYNLELDSTFIDAFQGKEGLKTLCILNPRIDWITRTGHPVPEILDRSPTTFESLLLIDLEDWEEEDYMPFTNLPVARDFLEDNRLKLVRAMADEPTPQEWYLEVALSGELWDLKKQAIHKDDPITEDVYGDE